MKNHLIRGLLEKVEQNEILPHVSPVPGLTPQDYFKLICNRFANPSIQDTIRRVAFDGSSRHAVFLVPTIQDGVTKNISTNGLALVEALWARMCEGSRKDGSVIEPNDPLWAKLNKIAIEAKDNPTLWLEQKEIYGSLSESSLFVESFTFWLNELYLNGVQKSIQKYLDE